MGHLVRSSKHSQEIGTIVTPSLQVRTRRPRVPCSRAHSLAVVERARACAVRSYSSAAFRVLVRHSGQRPAEGRMALTWPEHGEQAARHFPHATPGPAPQGSGGPRSVSFYGLSPIVGSADLWRHTPCMMFFLLLAKMYTTTSSSSQPGPCGGEGLGKWAHSRALLVFGTHTRLFTE